MSVLRFTLTADHLTLLCAANVGWDGCEYGAPAIDCKRPYGNSYVPGDIAAILGWQTDPDRGLSRGQEDHAREIHEQTRSALQVVLSTGAFEPGTYVSDDYGRHWRRDT